MMRILVVDSDNSFSAAVTQRLAQYGVKCETYAQAAMGIAALKKDPDSVDLVVIARELTGPGKDDGLEVAQAIRQDPKTAEVPFVLASSVWSKADFATHQKTALGANAYFSKKSSLADLDRLLAGVLGVEFAPSSAGAKAKSAGGPLQIVLEEASVVLNTAGHISREISLSHPIDVLTITNGGAPDNHVVSAPSAPAAPKPSPVHGPVEISITDSSAVSLETKTNVGAKTGTKSILRSKPVSAKPAAAAAAAAPSAPPTQSKQPSISLEIPALEIPSLESSSAPAPKPTSKKEVAKPAKGPDTETSLDGLDISLSSGHVELELNGPSSKERSKSIEEKAIHIEEDQAKEHKVIPPKPVAAAQAPSETGLSIDLQLSQISPAAEAAADVAAKPVKTSIVIDQDRKAEIPQEVSIVAESQTVVTSQPVVAPVPPPVSEEEAAKDLPYLFTVKQGATLVGIPSPQRFDNQVPAPVHSPSPVSAMSAAAGAGSDDIETLKRYLMMREQDVSMLTAQLSYAKEELIKSEDVIKRLNLQAEDLNHQVNSLKEKVDGQQRELKHAGRSRDGEVEQLRLEVKSKIDRIKFLEDRLNDSSVQYEKLKDRVRLDIRKIRVREKELESKLEILKKDSETLIAARENKILELKRKIDLLEFNYDTLQDKNELERQSVKKAQERLDRVLKVLKLASGIIDTPETDEEPSTSSDGNPGSTSGESAA